MSTQKTLNPQIIRLNDLLSEYDYRIVHRPGETLAHVDALSRAPVEPPEITSSVNILSVNTDEDVVLLYQSIDESIKVKKEISAKEETARTRYEKGCVDNYEMRNGILYKQRDGKLLYVVPKSMRKSLVIRFHDMKSHPGVERTVTRILEHYYFPSVRAYVKRHIRACLQCIVAKTKRGRQ